MQFWRDGTAKLCASPTEVGTDILAHAAESANAVVALGSCAVNGGWMAAYPNPSNALGVQQYLKKRGIDTPVVNVPGCPANPEWATSVLVDVLLVGQLPELTNENKPKVIFNQTVHDNCQRRGHFENGEFVYAFGTPEEAGLLPVSYGLPWSSDQGELRYRALEPSSFLVRRVRRSLHRLLRS